MKNAMPAVLYRLFCVMILLSCVTGCQTMSRRRHSLETGGDGRRALVSMTEALAGRALSEEEIRHLEQQIKTDKEAQTAIQSIADAVVGQQARAKYCPAGGEHYAPHLAVCPLHKVPLKTMETSQP